MKLTIKTDKETLKDNEGGLYINNSGIYDVKINYIQIAKSTNGAKQLNFNVKYNGNDQTIYGPYISNTNGEVNEITYSLICKLAVVSGLKESHELISESKTVRQGADQKLTDIEVFSDFSGVDVKMRIQMEYSLYNDKIQERKNIRSFFTPEGASHDEVLSGENVGTRLKLEQEKYATNVTYKNGLTEEDVKQWIQNKRNSSSSNTPTTKPDSSRKNVFDD